MNSAILSSSKLKLPSTAAERTINPDSVILYGVFAVLFCAPLAFGASSRGRSLPRSQCGRSLRFVDASTTPRRGTPGSLESSLRSHACLCWRGRTASCFSDYRILARYVLQRPALLGLWRLVFLASQTLHRSSQAKILAVSIAGYGLVVAIFALLQSLSATTKLYWLRTPRSGGWIYGPYVNHNHYAGLMEMLVPIPLVICQTRFAQGWQRQIAIVAAALMTGTIFLSGSRGGMLALVVEMAVLGVVLLRSSAKPAHHGRLGCFSGDCHRVAGVDRRRRTEQPPPQHSYRNQN